jgi:hypothetical protein
MRTHRKLWKVVQTHKMGAQAPVYFVETEYTIVPSKSTKENKEVEYLMALEKAKERSALVRFPSWTIDVVYLHNKYWNSKRGKWWDLTSEKQ